MLPTFGGIEGKLREDIEAVRRRTDKPFGVNITVMGRGFTGSRSSIIIKKDVPICTTGRAGLVIQKSVRMLKDAGINVVSVIPTRAINANPQWDKLGVMVNDIRPANSSKA